MLCRIKKKTFSCSIIILPESEQEIRMIDDAFGKVCSAVNDLSKSVRTIACQLLGTMTLVSSKFLHQTLDKKLMSNMRVSISFIILYYDMLYILFSFF